MLHRLCMFWNRPLKMLRNDDILEMENKLDSEKWNKIDRSGYFHSKQLERDQWKWDDSECTNWIKVKSFEIKYKLNSCKNFSSAKPKFLRAWNETIKYFWKICRSRIITNLIGPPSKRFLTKSRDHMSI